MSNTIQTPNMNLIIPVTSVDPGPDFANNVNASLLKIDSHNHSSGQGVQINPSGININADLPFNNNNATNLRSTRYTAQSSPLSSSTDYLSLSVSGADLYYLDGNGNSVRITNNGSIAGTSGSIGNLTSPASATYVSSTPAFVFQSAANTAADIDAGAYVYRNLTANSFGITVQAPSGLAASYTINWPAAAPSSTSIVQMDTAGNLSASNTIANALTLGSTLTIGGSGGPTISSSGSTLILPYNLEIGASAALLNGSSHNTIDIIDATNMGLSYPILVSYPGSNAGLMIVRGQVSASGSAVLGEGFYVAAHYSTGSYSLNFSEPFFDTPIVVVTINNGLGIATPIFISTSQVQINTFNTAFSLANLSFNFIAIGQRA